MNILLDVLTNPMANNILTCGAKVEVAVDLSENTPPNAMISAAIMTIPKNPAGRRACVTHIFIAEKALSHPVIIESCT